MWRRVGPRGFVEQMKKEASQWSDILPAIPRLVHKNLNKADHAKELNEELKRMRRIQKWQVYAIGLFALVNTGLLIWLIRS